MNGFRPACICILWGRRLPGSGIPKVYSDCFECYGNLLSWFLKQMHHQPCWTPSPSPSNRVLLSLSVSVLLCCDMNLSGLSLSIPLMADSVKPCLPWGSTWRVFAPHKAETPPGAPLSLIPALCCLSHRLYSGWLPTSEPRGLSLLFLPPSLMPASQSFTHILSLPQPLQQLFLFQIPLLCHVHFPHAPLCVHTSTHPSTL